MMLLVNSEEEWLLQQQQQPNDSLADSKQMKTKEEESPLLPQLQSGSNIQSPTEEPIFTPDAEYIFFR